MMYTWLVWDIEALRQSRYDYYSVVVDVVLTANAIDVFIWLLRRPLHPNISVPLFANFKLLHAAIFDKLSTSFLLFLYVFNQAKTSSLLSAEMTNTVIRMKKKDLSFHVGLEGRSPHSFNKSSWMEGRALFFLGTNNTEQFTKKHCCITLIEAKKDKNLNISQ